MLQSVNVNTSNYSTSIDYLINPALESEKKPNSIKNSHISLTPSNSLSNYPNFYSKTPLSIKNSHILQNDFKLEPFNYKNSNKFDFVAENSIRDTFNKENAICQPKPSQNSVPLIDLANIDCRQYNNISLYTSVSSNRMDITNMTLNDIDMEIIPEENPTKIPLNQFKPVQTTQNLFVNKLLPEINSMPLIFQSPLIQPKVYHCNTSNLSLLSIPGVETGEFAINNPIDSFNSNSKNPQLVNSGFQVNKLSEIEIKNEQTSSINSFFHDSDINSKVSAGSFTNIHSDKINFTPELLIKDNCLGCSDRSEFMDFQAKMIDKNLDKQSFLLEKLTQLIPADFSDKESLSQSSFLASLDLESEDDNSFYDMFSKNDSDFKLNSDHSKATEEKISQRPARIRIKPVAFWKGEKMIYDQDRNLIGATKVKTECRQVSVKKTKKRVYRKKPEKKFQPKSEFFFPRDQWKVENFSGWKQAVVMETHTVKIVNVSLRPAQVYKNYLENDSLVVILKCQQRLVEIAIDNFSACLSQWDNYFIPKTKEFKVTNNGKIMMQMLINIYKN